jgi:hypothetical protein
MKSLEERIVATVARARRRGLEPKSLYLNPADRAELGRREDVGGLPVRPAKITSRLYCRHGISLNVSLDRASSAVAPYQRPPPGPPRAARRSPSNRSTGKPT